MSASLGRALRPLLVVAASAASLAACASHAPGRPALAGTMKPYVVDGRRYAPEAPSRYDVTGVASVYSSRYQCQPTADGELFDVGKPTAAHKTLPLPSWVEVTNLENGRKARLRVNDRGPFARGRLVDLSPAAARRLGVSARQTAEVRVRYLGPAPALPHDDRRCG